MSHFTLAYINERMRCNPGCFSAGKCMSNCAAGRVCLAGSCIANCVCEKKKTKKNNFDDGKIQSQFLCVTNSRRKSKATSGGRDKSTGTSSESGSEIILLRSGATKRWIFPLEVKLFARLTL